MSHADPLRLVDLKVTVQQLVRVPDFDLLSVNLNHFNIILTMLVFREWLLFAELPDNDDVPIVQTKMNCLEKGKVFECKKVVYMSMLTTIVLIFIRLRFAKRTVTR